MLFFASMIYQSLAIASAYVAGPVHFLMLVIKEGDLRRIFLDTPDLTVVIPVSDLLP